MLTRRELLANVTRVAAVAGMAAAMPSSLNGVLAASPDEELLRKAPRARFWTSVESAGGDCRICHPGLTGMPPRKPFTSLGIDSRFPFNI